jgi:hypothetical protein
MHAIRGASPVPQIARQGGGWFSSTAVTAESINEWLLVIPCPSLSSWRIVFSQIPGQQTLEL